MNDKPVPIEVLHGLIPDDVYAPCPCGCGVKWKFVLELPDLEIEKHVERMEARHAPLARV